MTKACKACAVVKPLGEFYARHSKCKECVRAAKRNVRTCAACKATYQHIGRGAKRTVCDECMAHCKQCPACRKVKALTEFYGEGTRRRRCRACSADDNRERLYGLPSGEYERMYAAQDGRCAACGLDFDSLCVDHDHQTGKVRALLCDGCNKGIGCFKESIDGLTGAIAYLLRYSDVLEGASADG